jgi:hypothetical protein
MDVQGGNSLIYLPLDRLMQGATNTQSPGLTLPEPMKKQVEQRPREVNRSRRSR